MNNLMIFAAALLTGSGSPARVAAGDSPDLAKKASRLESVMEESQNGRGVANLPFARGQVFHSLDDYLAHLERQGAIDLPWWRQVAPGVYERVTNMRGRAPERATRAELMRRFGFAR